LFRVYYRQTAPYCLLLNRSRHAAADRWHPNRKEWVQQECDSEEGPQPAAWPCAVHPNTAQ